MIDRVRDTFTITKLILTGRRTKRVVWISAVIYLLVFLVALGDLAIHERTGIVAVNWVHDPAGLMLKQITPFRFEAIAVIEASVITYLFSPMNLLIAVGLAFLVGLNIAFTYLAVVAPKVCYGRPGAGVLASLPGLLVGWACCGPIILIVLGVQASASLIGLFGWLLPIALFLLVATLLFNAGRTSIVQLEQLA